MKRRLFYFVCLILLASAGWMRISRAEGVTVAPVILEGLSAYKQNGPEAAIKSWIKGGAFEGSKEVLSQANVLKQLQELLGSYQNYHVVHELQVSPATQIVYLLLEYEKGPVFSRFVAYRGKKGWVLSDFNFNPKPEIVFPPHLLVGGK